MGMAASQARFLGLTARKTNVEYEGQQINQQRVALSNKSAAYYNDLLTMTVPTAPSVTDYTTTVYSFSDGTLSNQLTSMIARADGSYTVSYLRSYTDNNAIVSTNPSIVTRILPEGQEENPETWSFRIGGEYLRGLDEWTGIDFSISDRDLDFTFVNGLCQVDGAAYSGQLYNNGLYFDGGKLYTDEAHEHLFTGEFDGMYFQNGVCYADPEHEQEFSGQVESMTRDLYLHNGQYYGDATYSEGSIFNGSLAKIDIIVDNNMYPVNGYYEQLNGKQFKGISSEEVQYLERLRDGYGAETDNWEVRYVLNTTTGVSVPNFYNRSTLENAVYSDDNQRSISSLRAFSLGSAPVTDEIKDVNAYLEQDATGRYTNITIVDDDGNQFTYALSTNTITDSDKYLDAMNQYEYDKALYDKNIQEVNAKIEVVQSEDKNLELRLKQLDTEEKAIQAEIDAVSSVIKNNVDKSFKTFNA